MNTIKKKEVEQKPSVEQEQVKEKSATFSFSAERLMNLFRVFNLFNRDLVIKNIPFVLYLTFIALFYIWNSYSVDKTVREIDKTDKELKELRSEFITGKSDLMYKCKMTEVAKNIEMYGVKESKEAPKKIIITNTNN
ncbi:MAG: FtsL-like putative cell division protein [Bacteroidota bacterium]